jgi:hypothetical protein
MKAPAFARGLIDRRRAGERIGLAVVALDWESGKDYEGKANVARVVAPSDFDLARGSWLAVASVDVLLVGAVAEARFYEAAAAIWQAGPLSLWADFDDGLHRLEKTPAGWLAFDGPVPAAKLGGALRLHRDQALLCASRIYGLPAFAPARKAVFEMAFGSLAGEAMRELAAVRRQAAGLNV